MAKSASSHSDAALIEQLTEKILNDHNKYRKQHHAPPLKLHETLSRIAQDWAEQLLVMGTLKHRPASKFGENIWTGSGYTLQDMVDGKADPVKSWYTEIKDYPDAPFARYGHFTQVVWKSSKYLGCGISYESDVIFVVCNYDPPGNWQNKYHENVFTLEGAAWGTKDEVHDDGKGKSADDDASPGILGQEPEEKATPYLMYGVGAGIVLIVVIFVAIIIYSQKS